jgi:hypothetical protein
VFKLLTAFETKDDASLWENNLMEDDDGAVGLSLYIIHLFKENTFTLTGKRKSCSISEDVKESAWLLLRKKKNKDNEKKK